PGLRRHTLANRKACCFPKLEGPRCVSPVWGQAAVATSGVAALDRRISACDGGRYAACLHPCAVPPKQFLLVNFLERRLPGVIAWTAPEASQMATSGSHRRPSNLREVTRKCECFGVRRSNIRSSPEGVQHRGRSRPVATLARTSQIPVLFIPRRFWCEGESEGET